MLLAAGKALNSEKLSAMVSASVSGTSHWWTRTPWVAEMLHHHARHAAETGGPYGQESNPALQHQMAVGPSLLAVLLRRRLAYAGGQSLPGSSPVQQTAPEWRDGRQRCSPQPPCDPVGGQKSESAPAGAGDSGTGASPALVLILNGARAVPTF